ncbi:hypothetical protein [Gordonibacter sp. Marseille-P4307]|uniref:hypothetical protein n=1 Tax=Gordonibacter sp. Marseille-P4307 TaxID=2161815 RepID=UPI000F5472D0|nr:hypothetical protein [Gordonibacter sp. Marseille-P4307]
MLGKILGFLFKNVFLVMFIGSIAASGFFSYQSFGAAFWLASEEPAAFMSAMAASFSLGAFVGMATRVPGFIKERKYEKRMFETASRQLEEADKDTFLSLDRAVKSMLVRLERAGGSKVFELDDGKLEKKNLNRMSTALVKVSDFGEKKYLLVLTDEGKRVLDNSRDLVDSFIAEQPDGFFGD